MAVRILIVDDHPLVIEGLRAVVALDSELEVVGHASSVAEAVAAVERLKPDVVLLDLTLREESGIDVLRQLRERNATARVVVLTIHHDGFVYDDAMRAGAHGYVVKEAPHDQVLLAIRAAAHGLVLSTDELFGRLVADLPVPSDQPEILTVRERQVLVGIVRGQTNREISLDLGLAVVTVKKYVQSILGKLGASDRTQAAIIALQSGLVR